MTAGSTQGPDPGRLLELTRESWAAQTRWGRESVDLLRSVWGNELDPLLAGRAYLEATRREGRRYLRSAGELGAQFARDLAVLGSQVGSGVVRDVATARRGGHTPAGTTVAAAARRSTTPSANPPSNHPGPPPGGVVPPGSTPVELRGPLGGVARARVTVVNRHPRARRIQMVVGAVTDEDGAAVPDLVVLVDPARVTVAAGAEAEVVLSVDLPDGVVQVGRTYRFDAQVRGGDEATLVCTLVVT